MTRSAAPHELIAAVRVIFGAEVPTSQGVPAHTREPTDLVPELPAASLPLPEVAPSAIEVPTLAVSTVPPLGQSLPTESSDEAPEPRNLAALQEIAFLDR